MRILIFTPYYPPHIGGVEFYAKEMNEHLAENKHILTVFTNRLPKNVNDKNNPPQIKIVHSPAFEIIPNYPLPKFWSPKFWQIFKNIFQQEFDLIISHTRFFNTSFLALVYASLRKTPWLHIEHGSDFVQSSNFIIRFIAKVYDYIFGRLILQKSDTNIAISQQVAEFIKKFDRRPTPIIHRGLGIATIDNIRTNNFWRNKYPNKIIVGFVGRLINGKGLLDLLYTLKRIPAKNFICLIIGDGPQKNILQKTIQQLHLQNKVFLLGKKERPETIALMKSFDIFVNPSYTEGLPTSVLEASACQNAIIATNVGGTREIIRHCYNGYLIKPKDRKSLQKYLFALIKNPVTMKKFGNRARQSTEQNFSWQKSIEKYEKIFKEILAEK